MTENDKIRQVTRSMSSSEWRSYRRTILWDLIMEEPDRQIPLRELQEKMRVHPIVAARQPQYGFNTAKRDKAVVMQEIKQKREEMAVEYIANHVEITDNMLDMLQAQLETQKELYYAAENEIDDYERVNRQLRIMEQMRKTSESIGKHLKTQQSLLPIVVPKQVHVQQTHEFSIDNFLAMKEEALKLDDGNVIEGEILED